MKALKDHAEFISESIQKFHNLLKIYENNEEELKREVENFISELYNRAKETIDIKEDALDDPNTKPETIIAFFMQASELWHVFCEKYKEAYPNDPPYFNEDAVLKTFESAYKKGWLFKHESAE